MANLAETPTFATGVYRIETTDPIIGGENGISNIQAKQLACRTAYLKARADLVDAAAGSFPNLSMRLDDIDSTLESVGPQMMNAEVGAIKFLFDQVNQANLGVRYLREVWQQEGKVTFTNRGLWKDALFPSPAPRQEI